MGAMRGHRWGQWGRSVTLSDLGAGALLLHPVCCKPHCCTPPLLQDPSPICRLHLLPALRSPFTNFLFPFSNPIPVCKAPPLCKLHPVLAIPDPFCIPLYPLLAPLPLLQPPPFTAPPFPQPVPLCPLYPTPNPLLQPSLFAPPLPASPPSLQSLTPFANPLPFLHPPIFAPPSPPHRPALLHPAARTADFGSALQPLLPIVQTGPSSPAAPLQPPPPLWSPALLWASFARLPAALHGFELLCWGFALLCWQLCMALHGSALLCMALHGSAWLCIALHCSAGSSAWLCIALHTLCMLPLSFACWFCSLHAPPARCRLCSACTALSACCRLCRCSPPPNKTPNTLCAFGSRLLGSQQWGEGGSFFGGGPFIWGGSHRGTLSW